MQEKLFVYGTLHPNRAPRDIEDVVCRLERVGSGSIRGRFYDFGEYPAVVLDHGGPLVSGEVFALPEDPTALHRLDDYEEYHPTDPESSLFHRLKTKVKLANGAEEDCWVYVYNRPLPQEIA